MKRNQVYLKLKDVLNEQDAYLSYETVSIKGSSWRNLTLVTAGCAKSQKNITQLQWNLLEDGNGQYRISSEANGMFISYDHQGNPEYEVKQWMYAESMSGKYFNTKAYLNEQRIWTLSSYNGGYLIRMNNNLSGSSLLLTSDNKIKKDWANVCVNTESFFNKIKKPENYKIFYLDTLGPSTN